MADLVRETRRRTRGRQRDNKWAHQSRIVTGMRNSGALGRKKKPQDRWQAARLNSMPLVVRVGRGRGTSGGHTCPWSAVTMTVESQKDTQPPAEVGSRPRRHGRNRKSPGHDGRPRGLCGTGGLGSGVSQVSARVRSMASPMRGHGQSQETCMETSGTRGCANSSARERTPKRQCRTRSG